MNAWDLYQIVKDLPREFWPFSPECFDVSRDPNRTYAALFLSPPYDGREPLRPIEDAVKMFEASMMRSLDERTLVSVANTPNTGKFCYGLGTTGKFYFGASRVEALVAACRAVKS